MTTLIDLNAHIKQTQMASLNQLVLYFKEDISLLKQKLNQLIELGYIKERAQKKACRGCPIQPNCGSCIYVSQS